MTAKCDFHLVPYGFVQSCLKDGHSCQEHTLSEEKYCKGCPERAFQRQVFIVLIRVSDADNEQAFNRINLAEYIDHDIKDVAEDDLL